MEQLLNPKQLAELLNVKLSTIYLWSHTEFIPCFRLGRCVRFRETDVIDWLEKRRTAGRKTLKYDTES